MGKTSARIAAGVLAFGLVFLVSSAAGAAAYLKIGDIQGEAAASPQTEIELLSWSWGQTGQRAPSGLGSGPPPPVTVTKVMDHASATLHRANLEKRSLTFVELLTPQGSGQEGKFISYNFQDVHVASYAIEPMRGEGGEIMVETIVFQAETVTFRPVRMTPKPKVKGNQ